VDKEKDKFFDMSYGLDKPFFVDFLSTINLKEIDLP